MTSRIFGIAIAALILTLAPASAQQTPPPYGAPINLDTAKKIMAAAEAEATKNNWQVVITIIDSGGHMVMMQRSDNTQLASIPASAGKAQTSLQFKLPSKALEDTIAAGGAGIRLLALKDISPFDGGFPIVVDGKIIGAIGVSGGLSSQDAQVARAGLNAVGN